MTNTCAICTEPTSVDHKCSDHIDSFSFALRCNEVCELMKKDARFQSGGHQTALQEAKQHYLNIVQQNSHKPKGAYDSAELCAAQKQV